MKIMQKQIDAGGSQGNGNGNGNGNSNSNNNDTATITNNGRLKPTASPPNFNLGSVTMSTPESRKRHSTVADAIDEI